MRSVIEELGDVVISDVLQEAVDEVTGRSRRKWAIVLTAVVVGSAWVALVIRRRRRSAEQRAGAGPERGVAQPSSDAEPTP